MTACAHLDTYRVGERARFCRSCSSTIGLHQGGDVDARLDYAESLDDDLEATVVVCQAVGIEAELVTVADLSAGDVVSFDEDPERYTVDDVFDLDEEDPNLVNVLFEGAACPSPLNGSTRALRWTRAPWIDPATWDALPTTEATS